jgi:hypothetical protein
MDPRTFGAVNRGLKIPNNAGRYEGRSSHRLVMAGIAVRRTASLPLAYVPAIYVLLD